MPLFQYNAVKAGKSVSGDLEASGRAEALTKLKSQGLTPLSLSEGGAPASAGKGAFKLFSSGRRAGAKDVTLFTVQLSALLSAKMNLMKALNALLEQAEDSPLRPVVASIGAEIEKGKPLSDALEAFPSLFPPLYVNMVRVGEAGGTLDKSMARLVDMRRKDEELAGKLKAALAYPCVMAFVMAGSLVSLLTFVMPRFNGVFSQMGTALPFPTRVVLDASSFLRSWWWLLLVLAFAAAGAFYQLSKDKRFMEKLDKFKLSLPVFGRLIQALSVSRVSFCLGALLSSGVPMLKSLEAAAPVAGNRFIEEALRQIEREVREGASLSSALRKRGEAFPALLSGMAGTGEEAGSLSEMLANAGEYYRKDSEAKIEVLTSLLEPAMIVVMGGAVGFVVSAILLPIFNVSTSIQ